MRKLNLYISLVALISILVFSSSCSTSWTTTIQWGNLDSTNFKETIDVEIVRGLMIVPVKIHGKYYRFLFDTGAPLSISNELQNEFNFPTVSTGRLVDSEKSRTKVSYIQVDTLLLNEIPFIEQTAFVTDFTSNPIIKCLNIDGILGSNLIRFCNWKIDFENQQITISNSSLLEEDKSYTSTGFEVDNQYSNLVNIKAGTSTIRNMKIDYGSNGSLSVPAKVFSTLKENQIFTQTFIQSGHTQSGILGDTKKTKRELAWLDTIQMNDFSMAEVGIRSGKSGLIGTKILSKQNVIINWEEQKIYFETGHIEPNNRKTFGCSFGALDDGTVYIQTVIENSNASKNGIRPKMQVLEIDTLDFTKNHTFCDYVKYNSEKETSKIVVNDLNGERREIHLTKEKLIPGN